MFPSMLSKLSSRLGVCFILVVAFVQCNIIFINEADFPAYNSYNNGVLSERSADIKSAMKFYQDAITMKPDLAEAHMNLGILYETILNHDKALLHHELSHQHAYTNTLKANSLSNIARVRVIIADNAIDVILRSIELLIYAISIESTEDVLMNLGRFYSMTNDFENSKLVFEELLQMNPFHIFANLNIGNYYFNKKEFDSALIWYNRAVDISLKSGASNSSIVMVLNNMGQCYREKRQLSQAISTFRHANEIISLSLSGANSELSLWTKGNLFSVSTDGADWFNIEHLESEIINSLRRIISSSRLIVQSESQQSFEADISLAYADSDSYKVEVSVLDSYYVMLMKYVSLNEERSLATYNCKGTVPVPEWQRRSRESPLGLGVEAAGNAPGHLLRVGYLSYDWRDHPMGRLTGRFVTSHNISVVSSTSFSYGPNDYSFERKLVENNSPHFVDMKDIVYDTQAALVIENSNIDILLDLTALTYKGRIRIAALKPASVVINFLGFPGTTGCVGFDYAMTDAVSSPPEISQGFTEKLIYLPRIYQANDMPFHIEPCGVGIYYDVKKYSCVTKQDIQSKKNRKITLCSYNANKKLELISFKAWIGIMNRVSAAQLFLLDAEDSVKANIHRHAMAHGIHSSRIIFQPRLQWEKHLNRLLACDLILDTFVYGAHTTASDGLWMWVPLVTTAGWGSSGKMSSRVASSLLHSLGGLSRYLIADSIVEYEDLVVRLCKSPKILDRIRESIAKRSLLAPTFDKYLFQLNLEHSLQLVWEMNGQETSSADYHQMHIVMMDNSDHKPAISLLAVAHDMLAGTNKEYEGHRFNYEDESHRSSLSLRYITALAENNDHYLLDAKQKTRVDVVSVDSGTDPCDAVDLSRITSSDSIGIAEYVTCLHHDPSQITDLIEHQHNLSIEGKCDESIALFENLFTFIFRTVLGWPEFVLDTPKYFVDFLKKLPFDIFGRGTHLVHIPLDFLVRNRTAYSNMASVLHNHGCCLLQAQRFDEAIQVVVSSYILDSDSKRKFAVGITLSSTKDYLNEGFILTSDIIREDHMFQHQTRLEISKTHQYYIAALNKCNECGKKRIAIFCGEYGNSWWPGWSYDSIGTGNLGGSEEAVLYLAETISRMQLGYHVDVYIDASSEDLLISNQKSGISVSYFHIHDFDVISSHPPDVFVAWRYFLSSGLGLRSRKKFLWLHDVVDTSKLPGGNALKIYVDQVFVPSEWHQQTLLEDVSKFTSIIPNGIFEDFLVDGTNANDRFIYASSPTRGLIDVLESWPKILNQIPNASLHVYYQMTNAANQFLTKQIGLRAFRDWRTRLDTLLLQKGVANHSVMATAFAESGYILYPTRFEEVGCLTVTKAMAMGAIPITSRLSSSVLSNLTFGYDFGPFESLTENTVFAEWLQLWVESVIDTKDYHDIDLRIFRSRMKEDIRKRYSWNVSATLFTQIIEA